MAIFQAHKNFYEYLIDLLTNRTSTIYSLNTLKMTYSDIVGDVSNPPSEVCPSLDQFSEYRKTLDLDALASGAGVSLDDVLIKQSSPCNCDDTIIDVYNEFVLYLKIEGTSTTPSDAIEFDAETGQYIVHTQLQITNSLDVYYLNVFELGYTSGTSYTPLFWHFTPLICIGDGSLVLIRLNGTFSLPNLCY